MVYWMTNCMLYSICWFDIINLNIVSSSCPTVPWASVHTSSSIGGHGNILKNIKKKFQNTTCHVCIILHIISQRVFLGTLACHSIKNKCQDSVGVHYLSMVHPWNPCWQNHLFSDIQTTPHFPHQQTATKHQRIVQKKMWSILTPSPFNISQIKIDVYMWVAVVKYLSESVQMPLVLSFLVRHEEGDQSLVMGPPKLHVPLQLYGAPSVCVQEVVQTAMLLVPAVLKRSLHEALDGRLLQRLVPRPCGVT